MTQKIYDIFLDNIKIGTTELEKADAPMGVVFGKINFIEIASAYDYLRNYCVENKIKVTDDYEQRLIMTEFIPNLKVVDKNSIEIKGLGTNIEGMDSDIFDITMVGVPYPFYEEEFPHHVKAYNEMFNS
jgi:hypothetical protein